MTGSCPGCGGRGCPSCEARAPAAVDPGGSPPPPDLFGRARAAAAALRSEPPEREPPELLAELQRANGTRLRVERHPRQGWSFVTIGVFSPRGEGWVPARGRQVVTLRGGELGPVLDALILAAEKASGERK